MTSLLANFRKKEGITQTELAQKAGVSRATIAAIETGKSKTVTLDTINKLATALNAKPSEIFLI